MSDYRLTYSVEPDDACAANAGVPWSMEWRKTRRGAAALAQRLADRDGCDYVVTTWKASNTVLMDARRVGVPLVVCRRTA